MSLRIVICCALTGACLPHDGATKHSDPETSVNLQIADEKFKVYLADNQATINSLSLFINEVGGWLELNDNRSSPQLGQVFVANKPLTLTTNLTFKDHRQLHTCASKNLPLASLITGKDSPLTHGDCQHSSDSPALIYAKLDYRGTNLAKYSVLRKIEGISCAISYNKKVRTLQFNTHAGLTKKITSHYLFTKEKDDEMFTLMCVLTSNLWPKMTVKSEKIEVSSPDKACIKFGKQSAMAWRSDHFKVEVTPQCPKNNFDLIVSFADEIPASPKFANRSQSQVTRNDKLKNISMLVQCADGCLPLTTPELLCRIERDGRQCLAFRLERESAFYGEFSLCGNEMIKDLGQSVRLRCNITDASSREATLQLTAKTLIIGKVCLQMSDDLELKHITEGNCSGKAEFSFFK